jgi:hypothetical protein
MCRTSLKADRKLFRHAPFVGDTSPNRVVKRPTSVLLDHVGSAGPCRSCLHAESSASGFEALRPDHKGYMYVVACAVSGYVTIVSLHSVVPQVCGSVPRTSPVQQLRNGQRLGSVSLCALTYLALILMHSHVSCADDPASLWLPGTSH